MQRGRAGVRRHRVGRTLRKFCLLLKGQGVRRATRERSLMGISAASQAWSPDSEPLPHLPSRWLRATARRRAGGAAGVRGDHA